MIRAHCQLKFERNISRLQLFEIQLSHGNKLNFRAVHCKILSNQEMKPHIFQLVTLLDNFYKSGVLALDLTKRDVIMLLYIWSR